MKIVHPNGQMWEHFVDEPELKVSELMLRVIHVGEGDDGGTWNPKIVKVTHQKDPERGCTYMEIYVDASREKVIN